MIVIIITNYKFIVKRICFWANQYYFILRGDIERKKEFQIILENAELYIQDAENFLIEGQEEVAILSIGYADGLVDALRLAKGMDPKM